MKIKVLSPLLCNQIAAGEVVERPASVIKELLENSLDAGATRLWINIEKGGVGLIRVRDNGAGIDKADLPLALARHATSKIEQLDDLAQIMSLGFRGEALASISAISRFQLQSKPANQEAAWQIRVDGSAEDATSEACAHPDGTTIEIRDLFFNTPARRKFLKAEKTEFFHIEEVVKRIALNRFDIAIQLTHNGKMLFNLPAANDQLSQEKRINKLFGQNFLQHAKYIELEASDVSLSGWVALPEFSRSQNDMQYFYINGRIVKDKLINHAVRQAYQDVLFEGRQAAYVLSLSCDPQAVDVNVHPTKHEVRFREARLVHDFLVRSLQQVLVSSEVNETVAPVLSALQRPSYASSYTRSAVSSATYQGQMSSYQQLHPAEKETQTNSMFGKIIGVLQQRYILLEYENNMIVVNSLAAQQFIAWQALQRDQAEGAIKTKPLLIPETVQLDKPQIQLASQQLETLKTLGIVYDILGPETIVLRQLPIYLEQVDYTALMQRVLEHLQQQPKQTQQLLYVIATTQTKTNSLSMQGAEHLLTELSQYQDALDKTSSARIFQTINLTDLFSTTAAKCDKILL